MAQNGRSVYCPEPSPFALTLHRSQGRRQTSLPAVQLGAGS